MRYPIYLGLALIIGLSFGACTTSDSGTTTDTGSETAGESSDTGGTTADENTEDDCADGTVDACGVCDGDGSTCAGCDGVANSGEVEDACGVCGGDDSTCAGCDGVANSGLVDDACGICDGDGSTCPPLTDSSVLMGRPFLVNLAEATWVQPAGAEMLVGAQVETFGLVMMALEESDLEGGAMHAVVVGTELVPAEEGAEEAEPEMNQDLCSPTPIVTAGDDQIIGTDDDILGAWEDPRIAIGPTNLTVFAQGQAVSASEVVMSGVFSEDGLSLTNGRLEGKLDIRSAAEGAGMSPDQLCQSAGMMGITCEECGGLNPGVYCISALIEDVTSEALEVFEPQVRTCADIVADETCADNIPSVCN